MPSLSFYHPFKNVSNILFNNKIVGKLTFNDNNEIITLDIDGYFYHTIKDMLLDAILFHFSTNQIVLNTLDKYQDYYEELGFEVDNIKIDNNHNIQMRYKK